MKYLYLLVFSLISFNQSATAHPHTDIEQQVLLTLGLKQVSIRIVIMPSFDEGEAIFGHLDTDENGSISDQEAANFASQVMARSDLKINNSAINFAKAEVTVPSLAMVSAGLQAIEIVSHAKVSFDEKLQQRISYQIDYQQLSHQWLIQPFYYPDLYKAMSLKNIQRFDNPRKLALLLAP